MERLSTDMRVQGILGRLDEILETENERIGKDDTFDMRASNTRKSRCLYELTLVMRRLQPSELSEATAAILKNVREKLSLNHVRVGAHLEAVRAVTVILKDAIAAAEADGTYSAEQFQVRAPA